MSWDQLITSAAAGAPPLSEDQRRRLAAILPPTTPQPGRIGSGRRVVDLTTEAA